LEKYVTYISDTMINEFDTLRTPTKMILIEIVKS